MSFSGAGLEVEEAPALVEQLRKFHALKQLDVSRNPRLGCVGAAAVLSADFNECAGTETIGKLLTTCAEEIAATLTAVVCMLRCV